MGVPISLVHRTGPVYERKNLKLAPKELADLVRKALRFTGEVFLAETIDDLPASPVRGFATSMTAVFMGSASGGHVPVFPQSNGLSAGIAGFLSGGLGDDESTEACVECINAGLWGYRLHDAAVYVLPRPSVKVDERNRVHCDDGPAVTWPSGKVEYWLHGVRVPEEAFKGDTELGLLAVSHGNAEVRRVLTEKYGLERLMSQLGNQVQEDETGALWKLTTRNANAAMVEVKNSTPEPDGSYRTYMLRVPPTVKTAREGVAWTFGMREKDYHPEVQT